MICKACAQGADLIPAQLKVGLVETAIYMSKLQHEKCQGCDCQHRVDLQVEGRSVRT